MKKIYVCLIALAVGHSVTAQYTVDFESHPLTPESYDNGSAGNGDFAFTQNVPVYLTNSYDTNWGSWTGFAISNMTDNTTAGWSNQYSAYTGSGANGSSNYAVFYSNGNINTGGSVNSIAEFKITNTAYAAISMRDGDAFGKQFGSPLNAQGNPDGTNGEDFFKVWVICESVNGADIDSIEFYLADYRFADSTMDYIVDTWETVDLTGLSFEVEKVSFAFESSDNDSVWGMNTPAYFAIDDVVAMSGAGIAQNSQLDVSVYPNPASDVIYIDGEEGALRLLDLQGKTLFEGNHLGKSTLNVDSFPTGIYVIQLENASGSYTNRIVIQ